jgi:hypothetical protein
MNKLSVILIIFLAVASFGRDRGESRLDRQLGAGYSAVFLDGDAVFPGGFLVFGGLGFKLTDMISIGGEYQFNMGWTSDYEDGKILGHVPAGYVNFSFGKLIGVTGLVGGSFYRYSDILREIDVDSGFLGARVTVSKFYAQVDVALHDTVIPKLGAGIMLGR